MRRSSITGHAPAPTRRPLPDYRWACDHAPVTAQIHDTVILDGKDHDLVAVDGGPLFDPAGHGIELAMISTACWRGHVCVYTIKDDRLLLETLMLGGKATVGGERVSTRPAFAGVRFTPNGYGEYLAEPLSLEIPFSGRLAAARTCVGEYVHMGFAPGWKYARVIELTLENGRLTRRRDRSAQAAVLRQAIERGELPDPDGTRGAPGWVSRSFELDYDRTFPGRADC
jgi:hypothetical protein